MGSHVKICKFDVQTDLRWSDLRMLFEMYAVNLSVDLAYQNFTSELAALPRIYGDVQGGAWVAYIDQRACACAALRPLGPVPN